LVDENTERLVERELILRDFEASGFSVPESVIDDYLQQQIRRDFNGNRAIMAKTLQAEGRTLEKYREQVRTQFIVSQMRLKNISDAIMISPHKIEVYYVAHTNDFQVEDQIKLRMIVLNKSADDPGQARRLAEEILSKIQGGASFAEMATAYSQDSRRSQGGSWDWERTSVLRKEFADAAAALKTGEHSSIIDAPEACYIMLVEDKRPAHIRPLSEVRDDIESTLLREERQRLENQWISRLKKKTFVRYF
jgi:parvulin-like peptidyl-prolyl isomerase